MAKKAKKPIKKQSPLGRLKKQCVELAMKQYLAEHPYCELCGAVAETCHHYIYQSQSNYLKCDERNLVAICNPCHCSIHVGHREQVAAAQLVRQRGYHWSYAMEADRHLKIKDNMEYWRNKLAELRGEK